MYKLVCLLLALLLALPAACPARAEQGAWIVEEDGNDFSVPDRLSQTSVLMRDMTLEDKVWQLLVVTPEALTGEKLTSKLGKTNVLEERPVGGVILFGQNIVSDKQLSKLTGDLQAQAKKAGVHPLLIGVSEEGGSVARVANKLGYPLEMSAPEAGLRKNPDNARKTGANIAAYLKSFGINLDLAPVCDVVTVSDSWIMERSYGSDPQIVANMALSMAAGLKSQGITACYSHFPGQGSINGNLNNREVVNTRTLDEMRSVDWLPFRSAIVDGAPMIMVSHAPSKAAGDGLPASLSPVVIGQWLRKELNYQGVVITDSLRMGAITSGYTAGDAAVLALKAGADLLLLPKDADAAVKAILKAISAGEISEDRIDESVRRVLIMKIEQGVIR